MTDESNNAVFDVPVAARPDDLVRGSLVGGLSGPAYRLTPEQIAAQEAAHQRAEAERQEWQAKEDRQRSESRDDSLRTSALHGALMLDYPSKDAASVLAAARQIEAFMRGVEAA